jgi:hypothetical protein
MGLIDFSKWKYGMDLRHETARGKLGPNSVLKGAYKP